MYLRQIDVTGCRLVGAITKELSHNGPKHHAVVLGQSLFNGEIYLAELMASGLQATTYTNFLSRYAANGPIIVQPNDGPISNLQVAQRAIAELQQGGATYDLIANNCECFVNRAMHGKSSSSQVANTALGLVVLVGLVYMLKNAK